MSDPENQRRRRRFFRGTLALRSAAVLLLAVGVVITAIHHVWLGVAFLLLLIGLNLFWTQRAVSIYRKFQHRKGS